MDIEQLKLILETLQGVGHEAGNLAVLYLWLQFAGGVLTNLSAIAVLLGVTYLIYKAIMISQGHDETEAFLCEMRDQLGTGVRGLLSRDERQRTTTALRKLVAKHKEQA
jgi:hypothetical protein